MLLFLLSFLLCSSTLKDVLTDHATIVRPSCDQRGWLIYCLSDIASSSLIWQARFVYPLYECSYKRWSQHEMIILRHSTGRCTVSSPQSYQNVKVILLNNFNFQGKIEGTRPRGKPIMNWEGNIIRPGVEWHCKSALKWQKTEMCGKMFQSTSELGEDTLINRSFNLFFSLSHK